MVEPSPLMDIMFESTLEKCHMKIEHRSAEIPLLGPSSGHELAVLDECITRCLAAHQALEKILYSPIYLSTPDPFDLVSPETALEISFLMHIRFKAGTKMMKILQGGVDCFRRLHLSPHAGLILCHRLTEAILLIAKLCGMPDEGDHKINEMAFQIIRILASHQWVIAQKLLNTFQNENVEKAIVCVALEAFSALLCSLESRQFLEMVIEEMNEQMCRREDEGDEDEGDEDEGDEDEGDEDEGDEDEGEVDQKSCEKFILAVEETLTGSVPDIRSMLRRAMRERRKRRQGVSNDSG